MMNLVLIKWNGVSHFDGHLPNVYVDIQGAECRHKLSIEIGDGARGQGDRFGSGLGGANEQLVLEKIELDFEIPIFVRNNRSSEPTRTYVERHVPPMIGSGR